MQPGQSWEHAGRSLFWARPGRGGHVCVRSAARWLGFVLRLVGLGYAALVFLAVFFLLIGFVLGSGGFAHWSG